MAGEILIVREYMSGSPARFKSCVRSKKKSKVDAVFASYERKEKLVFKAVST